MAFSFRQSNMRGLLTSPLSAAVFLASMITPRRPKRWVFGRKGMYGGNSRYLMEYVVEHHPEIECIWLAHSEGELEAARAAGVRAVLAKSWKGWWAALTAKVGIVSIGLEDVNRAATGGMSVVQLWHGLPLKKIGLDTPAISTVDAGILSKPLGRLIRFIYHFMHSRYALCIAPSDLIGRRFQSAFGLSEDRVALTGEPNADIILGQGDNGQCSLWQARMVEAFDLPASGKVVMYAPTWREDNDFDLLPDSETLDALEDVLKARNASLLLRAHYFNDATDSAGRIRPHIFFISSKEFPDVNYLLSGIDVIISDYSGILMDFSLLERPVIFFAPDLERYAAERGLYESYETFSGGKWVSEWPDLVRTLDQCLAGDDAEFRESARRLSARHNGKVDTNNRMRVYEEIRRCIGV